MTKGVIGLKQLLGVCSFYTISKFFIPFISNSFLYFSSASSCLSSNSSSDIFLYSFSPISLIISLCPNLNKSSSQNVSSIKSSNSSFKASSAFSVNSYSFVSWLNSIPLYALFILAESNTFWIRLLIFLSFSSSSASATKEPEYNNFSNKPNSSLLNTILISLILLNSITHYFENTRKARQVNIYNKRLHMYIFFAPKASAQHWLNP